MIVDRLDLDELPEAVAGAERVQQAGLVLWRRADGDLIVLAAGADEAVRINQFDTTQKEEA